MLIIQAQRNSNLEKAAILLAKHQINADIDYEKMSIAIDGTMDAKVLQQLSSYVNGENSTKTNLPTDASIDTISEHKIKVKTIEQPNQHSAITAYSTEVSPTSDTPDFFGGNKTTPMHTHKNTNQKEFCRGQIYLVDFGDVPSGHEIMKRRPAMVIQSSETISGTSTIIMLPISTKKNHIYHIRCAFGWEKRHMRTLKKIAGFTPSPSYFLFEQIRALDVSRVGDFIGQVTDEYFDTRIQPKLEELFDLKLFFFSGCSMGLTLEQIRLLSIVDLSKILKIADDYNVTKIEKGKRILQLYGLDFNKRGSDLVLTACTANIKGPMGATLHDLARQIQSLETHATAEQIEKLLVARVKELTSHLPRKISTMSFLKLIRQIVCKEDGKSCPYEPITPKFEEKIPIKVSGAEKKETLNSRTYRNLPTYRSMIREYLNEMRNGEFTVAELKKALSHIPSNNIYKYLEYSVARGSISHAGARGHYIK